MKKILLYAMPAALLTFAFSGYAKSYLSIVSKSDDRGVNCEVDNISPEPNVMGIIVRCKETVKIDNIGFSEFSLVWPETENVDDKKIQSSLIEEILSGKELEETEVWVTAQIGSLNPRNFLSPNVPVVNLLRIAARTLRTCSYEYQVSNKEMHKLIKSSSDSEE